MIALINIIFILIFKVGYTTPADTSIPSDTEDLPDTDASKSKYEIYVYETPGGVRVDYISEEAAKNASPIKPLKYFFPDAFLYSSDDGNRLIEHLYRANNTYLQYSGYHEISKSEILDSVSFLGESYDVRLRYGRSIDYDRLY